MAAGPAARPFSGLWFSSREEEAQFSKSYAAAHFRPMDRAYHRLGGFVFDLIVAVATLRSEGLSRHCVATLVTNAASMAMHCLWIACGADWRPELRTRITLAHKVLASLGIIVLSPGWHKAPPTSPATLVQWLIGSTAIGGLVFFSFATPLLMKHHLAVQVPAILLAVVYTPSQTCAEGTMSAGGAPYVLASWRWLNALCTGGSSGAPTPPVTDCCRAVVVVFQLMLALCVPSYMLWASEYRARLRHRPGALPGLGWKDMAVHGMLFLTAMSCVWVLLHLGVWA